jgi:hypothetical protein
MPRVYKVEEKPVEAQDYELWDPVSAPVRHYGNPPGCAALSDYAKQLFGSGVARCPYRNICHHRTIQLPQLIRVVSMKISRVFRLSK